MEKVWKIFDRKCYTPMLMEPYLPQLHLMGLRYEKGMKVFGRECYHRMEPYLPQI